MSTPREIPGTTVYFSYQSILRKLIMTNHLFYFAAETVFHTMLAKYAQQYFIPPASYL